MKKTAIIFILWALMLCVFSANVCAEEALTAPVVQYKLIDHDKIALRWDAVEGADGYYIYRTDVKTGKTFRYPSVVNKTENTIGWLSPDTEYIFSVAPIKKNGDKITVGKRSSGTKLITPKKWYYYCEYDYEEKTNKEEAHFYKENFKKTKKEEIQIGDIIAADDVFYYNGWFYVLGDYLAIAKPEHFDWSVFYGGSGEQKCVARIKEDGTHKEILIEENYIQGGGVRSYYQIVDNDIYIYSFHKSIYKYDNERETNNITYYSDPKFCWLKKISLKTGKVETLLSSCLINWFYYSNGYIYYEYDDSMTLSYDDNNNPLYISGYYDNKTQEQNKYTVYYCKMNANGEDRKIINKHTKKECEIDNNVCINDNQIAFIYDNSIYTTTIKNEKKKKIYECKSTISKKIQIINGYIYFSERIDDDKTDDYRYCRIKTDGAGLEKQDKPFEWYY